MESSEYQQLMFNLLGNRDYDNFESDELDNLKKKIGYALYGYPQTEGGYDVKQEHLIEKLYNVILKQSDKFSKHKNRVVIAFVYNCTEPMEHEKVERAAKFSDYNPKHDIQAFPVFILRKCKFSPTSCRIVIDHIGRVYYSWDEYLWRNTLPKCAMIYPKDGRYTGDENGNVILESQLSPACGARAKVLAGTDIASTGIGLTSAGIAIAASIPAITTVGPLALCGAGVAGIGVGIYSIGRSLGILYDKKRHKESMSFSNSIARAAYINIIAGAIGFVGAGANVAISQFASRGINIGREASILANTISAANLGTSGLAIINSGYGVLEPWLAEKRAPSLLSFIQLSSSVLFFGHAVYNFKSVNQIIEETQAKVLTDIQNNLKFNRYRKAFEKLRMETIRRNEGNVQRGNAEVIATMRKIMDKNQLFDILAKVDDTLDNSGMKYTAKQGGLIAFNGVPVDLEIVTDFTRMDLENFFSLFRSDQITTPNNICEIKNNLRSCFEVFKLEGGGISRLSNYFVGLTGSVGSIVGPIMCFIKGFINQYLAGDEDMLTTVNDLFPNSDEKCLHVINSVIGFIFEEAKKIDDVYKSPEAVEGSLFKPIFQYVSAHNLNDPDRYKYFMKFVCDAYGESGKLSLAGLDELKKYFVNALTKQMVIYQEKRKKEENRRTHERKVDRIKCPNCSGLRYTISKE